MAQLIEFVKNYQDLSSDTGFQFEFSCDRCEAAYRTKFKASATGNLNNILDAAGSLFGGILSTASDLTDRVHSAAWEKAHDSAFEAAVKEVSPDFIQCPRCQSWVCRKKCWNTKKGLCKECAPDLGVEMAKAQSDRSVEEIHAHAAMAEEDKHLAKEDWRQTITATCPACEQSLATNAKFCPHCGHTLKSQPLCQKCGAKLAPKAMFCSECGQKT